MNALLLVVALLSTGAQPKPQTYEWIDHLDTWVTAVRDHSPGRLDDPALAISAWPRAVQQTAWLDVNAMVKLIRCGKPNCRITVTLPDGRPAPWRSMKGPEQDRFKQVVDRAAKLDVNILVKRGAILHGDIAMLAQQDAEPIDPNPPMPLTTMRSPVPQSSATRQQAAPETLVLRYDDGQQRAIEKGSIHWEFARALLDSVAPRPGEDETVRLWYQATLAYLQREQQLDSLHFDRARKLFPDDPRVVFDLGCLHEAYAGASIQNTLKAAVVPRGVKFDIGDERDELRKAEPLFRRALELQPDFVEARLRFGRTLGLLGRHADALRELTAAADATDEPLLRYYARLFIGAEEAALGRLDEARQAYEAAAALYRHAQSPHLALSQLAQRRGDRVAALQELDRAFTASADALDRDDPWWLYYVAPGRDVEERLDRAYAPFVTAPKAREYGRE
jgi:tetratricopeptide (TPR) repeat protein